MYPSTLLPKPLRPAEYYALLALSRGSSHIYPLKGNIANASLGSVQIGYDKLYPLIHRLVANRLVEFEGTYPAGPSDKPRRYYALTELGRIRLHEESQRMEHAVQIARYAGVLEDNTPTEIRRLLLNVRTDGDN